MTARDLVYGRQAGRVLPWASVPGAFAAVCDCTAWLAVEANLGEPCGCCGAPIRRPDAVDGRIARAVAS